MNEDKHKPVPLISLLLVVLMVIVTAELACAQHVCQGGHNCNRDGTPVDVSQVAGGNVVALDAGSSLGLGFGGAQFDVDIAQCMGSESTNWFFGAYAPQRLKENYWCHAITLANAGYIDAAEYILCTHTKLSEMPNCPGEIFRKEAKEGTAGPLTEIVEEIDDHEEEAERQHQEYQMQITDLAAQIEDLKRPRPPVVQRVIEQRPFLSDEKRAALLAVKEE